MRSFIVSILATLAFALFASAAPMPAGAAPVNAISARDDSPTFQKTFNKCIDGVKPHTDALLDMKVDMDIEVVIGHVNAIKDCLNDAMVDVKAMVALDVNAILCDENGIFLGVTVIAGICVQLLTMIFGACASLLACVSVELKVQLTAVLFDLCCLLGDLLCALFNILVALRVEIIACILPQIAACIKVILELKITALIELFNC